MLATTEICREKRSLPVWPTPRLEKAKLLDPAHLFYNELPLSAVTRQVPVARDAAILAKGKKPSSYRWVEAIQSQSMSAGENGDWVTSGNCSTEAKSDSVI